MIKNWFRIKIPIYHRFFLGGGFPKLLKIFRNFLILTTIYIVNRQIIVRACVCMCQCKYAYKLFLENGSKNFIRILYLLPTCFLMQVIHWWRSQLPENSRFRIMPKNISLTLTHLCNNYYFHFYSKTASFLKTVLNIEKK